ITQKHLAVLDPPVPILEPVLRYPRTSVTPGGPTGYREVQEIVSMYAFDAEGRLGFWAGLLPRVQAVLRAHGYKVRVDDQRNPGPRLSPSLDLLNGGSADERALLQRIANEPLG